MKSQLQITISLENKKSNYKISKLKSNCNFILFKSNYDVINQEDSLTFYQISI